MEGNIKANMFSEAGGIWDWLQGKATRAGTRPFCARSHVSHFVLITLKACVWGGNPAPSNFSNSKRMFPVGSERTN